MRISYDKFGLKEVINASGKMTILGVSKISENVLAAQRLNYLFRPAPIWQSF